MKATCALQVNEEYLAQVICQGVRNTQYIRTIWNGVMGVNIDGVHIPNVAQVQADLLHEITAVCEACDARLILSDPVLSVRPTFWICADAEQKQEIACQLLQRHVRLYRLEGNKRAVVDLRDTAPVYTIAYKRFVAQDVVIHGASSGIHLVFCAYLPEQDLWKAPRGGLETAAVSDSLNALPMTTCLGQVVPTFPTVIEVEKQHPAREPVDIVYTWVNGDDPAWQARKTRYADTVTDVRDAQSQARFDPGRDLLFSVRSVLRYFKNHGRIFVVTDDQTPDLLGELQDQVTVIDHREIFADPSHLPTFNSHTIEANLHRIPGLSQRYVYLNDDVMFGAAVSAAHFFDELGRSKYFPSRFATVPSAPVSYPDSPVDIAARNNQRIIRDRFGTFPFMKFMHAPIAMDKRVMQQMEQELPQAWSATLPNRFRSPHDHSISGHLYFHYAAAIGAAIKGSLRYTMFQLGKESFADRLAVLRKDDWIRPESFCVNETSRTPLSEAHRRLVDTALDQVLVKDGMALDPIVPKPAPAAQDLAPPPPLLRRWVALAVRWLRTRLGR